MRLVLLTSPTPIEGEVETITEALDRGEVSLVHLRRPDDTRAEAAAWLRTLPDRVRRRTVLHDHYDLTADYPDLYGLHLNSRHPEPPADYRGHLSRSCHTLDEVRQYREACDYLFLSPIFDSISKRDYPSRFTPEELREARDAGLIDERVYALGGVTRARLPLLEEWGFGGAALLGDFWRGH